MLNDLFSDDDKDLVIGPPGMGAKIFRWTAYICAGLVVLDLLVRIFGHPHWYFWPEYIPAFYGIYGFVAFVFIVYAGRGLRELVMRDEDYYDR